ncbi:hypothetical protein CH371_05395 [Leptospira wolffii]|uniref:Tetratricopeptide repeat protein n=1 Tax=Leptospira wolffii TaxID=409998 RepID=A0A2M9ZGF5_9LEPT|nr:hypothetical protein [Leptospira wolffii]PJZ67454.1 hypothetical protein CH371_05395 [Leptospira wolffii]
MQKFRLGFLAAILLCSQLHCATLGAVFIVGSPVNGTKASIGTGIGFAGDMAIAVKIGSLGGVVYGLTSALTLLFILGISVIDSDLDREMEYAAYPKSSQGRLLQKFIGTARTTLLVLEPPSHSSYGNEKLEKQIYASFDEFGYFRLISSEKRVDLILTGSWNEIRNRGKVIGKETGSELILHVKVLPYSSGCGVEPIQDTLCEAGRLSAQQDKFCPKRPTAYRFSKIPIEAKLLNIETGESIIAASRDASFKNFTTIGNLNCPAELPEAWKAVINESAEKILSEISPRMKETSFPRPITKDPNPEVEEILKDGYEELRGEIPNYRKALLKWQEADKISGGKSDGALINIGLYYIHIGVFDTAIRLFLQAEKLEGPNHKLARILRKKIEEENRN